MKKLLSKTSDNNITLGAQTLNHIAITCRDIEKSFDFYINTLGLSRNTSRGGYPKIEIGPHTFIELFEDTEECGSGRVPLRHFAIVVEDLDQAITYLENRAVPIIRGPFYINKQHPELQQQRVCFIEGPDKEEIELVEECNPLSQK